jgi:hypothetical protein
MRSDNFRAHRATQVFGLAKFLDDLADVSTTRIAARIVATPVVVKCDWCPKYYHPAVRFVDHAEPVITGLPDFCECSRKLATDETRRDVIGTARNLLEAAAQGRRPS